MWYQPFLIILYLPNHPFLAQNRSEYPFSGHKLTKTPLKHGKLGIIRVVIMQGVLVYYNYCYKTLIIPSLPCFSVVLVNFAPEKGYFDPIFGHKKGGLRA